VGIKSDFKLQKEVIEVLEVAERVLSLKEILQRINYKNPFQMKKESSQIKCIQRSMRGLLNYKVVDSFSINHGMVYYWMFIPSERDFGVVITFSRVGIKNLICSNNFEKQSKNEYLCKDAFIINEREGVVERKNYYIERDEIIFKSIIERMKE